MARLVMANIGESSKPQWVQDSAALIATLRHSRHFSTGPGGRDVPGRRQVPTIWGGAARHRPGAGLQAGRAQLKTPSLLCIPVNWQAPNPTRGEGSQRRAEGCPLSHKGRGLPALGGGLPKPFPRLHKGRRGYQRRAEGYPSPNPLPQGERATGLERRATPLTVTSGDASSIYRPWAEGYPSPNPLPQGERATRLGRRATTWRNSCTTSATGLGRRATPLPTLSHKGRGL